MSCYCGESAFGSAEGGLSINTECLPFTEKIRKFRLECKWKDYFGSPDRKISE